MCLATTQGLAGPKNWSLIILLGSNIPYKASYLEFYFPSSLFPGTFIYHSDHSSVFPTIKWANSGNHLTRLFQGLNDQVTW